MKKRGFTLIELIFTIVIIGVLAAVAIPKYKSLKASSEINNMFKVATDVVNSIPSAYANAADLQGISESDITLKSLVNVSGKGWKYSSSDSDRGVYEYVNMALINSGRIIRIALIKNKRIISYQVYCSKITKGETEKDLCKSKVGNEDSYSAYIKF